LSEPIPGNFYTFSFLFKVSSVPALAEVKLACWNQFNDRDDSFLPSGKNISITDNTKKKTIALIKNDAQLLKAQCIGYLCEEKVRLHQV